GGKYSLFEGGTRLPFIVSWPGTIKPGTSDALVSQIDLLASFAEMTDVDLEDTDGKDSKNLLKVFLGESDKGRTTYIEQNNSAVLAYLKNDWKYIEPAKGPAVNESVNIET